MDTLADWINEASVVKERAEAQIKEALREHPSIDAAEVRRVLDEMADIPDLLRNASPEQRQKLYQGLGVKLRYDPVENTVHGTQDASEWMLGSGRVGGGT